MNMILNKLSSLIFVLLFFTASLFGQSVPTPTTPAKVLYILDGDTIVVWLNGQKESVRLLSIDCPEIHDNPKLWRDAHGDKTVAATLLEKGKASKKLTQTLVPKNSTVNLEFDCQKRDKYNRLLAYVYLPDGQLLNLILFKQGAAKAYLIPPNFKHADLFRTP